MLMTLTEYAENHHFYIKMTIVIINLGVVTLQHFKHIITFTA